MSVESLFTQTCAIQRKTSSSSDGWGQPETSWSTIATGVKCRLSFGRGGRGTGREEVVPVQAAESSGIVFLPAGTDVDEDDRIVITGGQTWDVIGYPKAAINGVGATNHLRANVRRVVV